MDHIGIGRVIKGLVVAADALTDAMHGAQTAKDEALFHRIYDKQEELHRMIGELVKVKEERNAIGKKG